MANPAAKDALQVRSIRTDGLFYLTLAAIGGTYVVLILMLLAADVAYLVTSRSSEQVVIDFSVDSQRTPLRSGDYPGDRFRDYGLTVLGGTDTNPIQLLDSSRPGELDFLGTPHEDFDGPGRGDGGRRGAKTVNDRPLGNVLLLMNNDTPAEGTLEFHWQQPVELDRFTLLNAGQGGKYRCFDPQGVLLNEGQLPPTAAASVSQLSLGVTPVARLEIDLPAGGAVADLAFFWDGRLHEPWERNHPLLAAAVHNPITAALSKPEIQYSIFLSLASCTITTILSLWVAVPIGYLLSRHRFFGRNFIDAVLDIPIVLPPLVVGLSLLILFQFAPTALREIVVYKIPAVILAQFAVACAFAVRTMRATFDQIDARREQVALTLGCSRASAFIHVVLPEARRGMLTAGTLAWARALGEFGPLLIFAGATRNKTEVLSTTVFLELSVGDLGAAVAVSMIMVVAAVTVLILARMWGTRTLSI